MVEHHIDIVVVGGSIPLVPTKITSEVFRQVPPRVDYSATPLGLSLEPVMLALCDWGTHHARELDELDRIADCIIRPVNTDRAADGAR